MDTATNEGFPLTDECRFQNGVKKIKMIMSNMANEYGGDLEELILIDVIQRLGLEYYFQKDIRVALEKQFAKCNTMGYGAYNLHEAALRFRLLRQEGHNAPVDTFVKFKDDNGRFLQEFCEDIKGLTSLFEASQLCIQGDEILHEAGEFSGQLLENSLRNAKKSEAIVIRNTLSSPYQRSLPRLMGKSFLLNFEISLRFLHDFKLATGGWTNDIQDIARIEFNMAQIIHQSEITQVSRWWKQLRLTEELKLARDQPVKWYMWSLIALPNPNVGEERIQLTKPISLVYIIDDIFDVYGTLEELTMFTEAVKRWESADKRLPGYMNKCLRVINDTTNEISHKIFAKHGWNPKDYIKKAWADLCNAFLVEAKWLASGELPSSEEYLKNGIVSSGVPLVFVHLFYLLEQRINSRSVSCLDNVPDVVKSAATILRLWDDLGSAKDENQSGRDGSFIDCYLKENQGSSTESAQRIIRELVSDAWKCLNEKSLSPSTLPPDFIKACLNAARMVPMMYNYDENHRLPDLERHMTLFLYGKV